MSWLNPGEIKPSDYNPQKSVETFVAEYGEIGKRILECFNRVDPFHTFAGIGENVDEYEGYARRFMERLGNINFDDLTQEQLSEFVRNSFTPDQIGKFITETDLELLIKDIKSIRK